MLENIKIRIRDEEHSKFVQKELFRRGYEWQSGNVVSHLEEKCIACFDDGVMTYMSFPENFDNLSYEEIFIEKETPRHKLKDIIESGAVIKKPTAKLCKELREAMRTLGYSPKWLRFKKDGIDIKDIIYPKKIKVEDFFNMNAEIKDELINRLKDDKYKKKTISFLNMWFDDKFDEIFYLADGTIEDEDSMEVNKNGYVYKLEDVWKDCIIGVKDEIPFAIPVPVVINLIKCRVDELMEHSELDIVYEAEYKERFKTYYSNLKMMKNL